MTNQNQQKPARPGQFAAIGFKIAGTITDVLSNSSLSFEEANYLILSNKHELEQLTEKFCTRILNIKIDPWIEEKKRIEKFYKKFFHRTIDWSKIIVPGKKEGMNKLEVIFPDITEDETYNIYTIWFPNPPLGDYSSVREYESITKVIHKQQERPEGVYAFCHIGGDEPDMLGKNYNDGINGGFKFMIPKEGIIAAFRHRVETSKMYDIKNSTHFATLVRGIVGDDHIYTLCMECYPDGRFLIFNQSQNHSHSFPDHGLRQVDF